MDTQCCSEWTLNRLIHFCRCDTILLFNEMSNSLFFHTFQTEAKFAVWWVGLQILPAISSHCIDFELVNRSVFYPDTSMKSYVVKVNWSRVFSIRTVCQGKLSSSFQSLIQARDVSVKNYLCFVFISEIRLMLLDKIAALYLICMCYENNNAETDWSVLKKLQIS